MTVKELIEKLQGFDQDATVIVDSNNFELNYAFVPLSYIKQWDNGSKKEETFHDAFDGTPYTKTTWDMTGGNTPVVYIS